LKNWKVPCEEPCFVNWDIELEVEVAIEGIVLEELREREWTIP